MSWPPPIYSKPNSLVPSSEHNETVLVLGAGDDEPARPGPCRGDMTEKVGRGCPPCDLQQRRRGGSTLLLKRYNAGRMVRPECWCDKLCTRLPEGAVCTDVPNMGRSEAAFFQYVYDHYSVRLRPLLRTRGRSTRCPRASPRAKAPVETCSPCSSWTLKSDNKDPAAFER